MKKILNLCALLCTTLPILVGCRDGNVFPWDPTNPNNNSSALTIPDVYGVEWKLESYEEWNSGKITSSTPVSPLFTYTLVFEQNGRLHGGDECAVYKGEYALGNLASLTTFNISEPEVACGPRSGTATYLTALKGAESYQAAEKNLRIFYNGGTQALYFSRIVPSIQIVPYELIFFGPGDPFQLKDDLKINGDVLTMNVTYGGGCENHSFDLFGPKTIPPGNPTPVTAYLIHHANNDLCKALISEHRTFDLTPLKKQWQMETGRTSGEILLTISSFNVGGPDRTISYRF